MSTTEEIKNRLDVAEFIGTYLRLQKAGRNFRALCPFHNEKTPSFMVSTERQMWHCFGCNESGDIFTFLMKIEGIEFKDALAQLAQRAGVRLEKFDTDLTSRRQKIYNTLEAATKFYENTLWGKSGLAALEYITNRGLTKKTVKDFRIGYSLDSWDALLNFLESKGLQAQDAFDAGLAVKRDESAGARAFDRGYYDRFRNRIMFPIHDIGGKVIGFSARVMPGGDDKMGKYINTPETLVYNKSKVIYALDKAKLAIRKSNFCIFVEGQLDVIMSHQAGVNNTVATSGTALTVEHLNIVKRYTKNLALCFDSDEAGSSATKRAIDLAIATGFSTKVITLGNSKDPADIIVQDPKLWAQAIAQKKPVISFYFENIFSRHNPDEVEGKKKIADELLPVIKLIPNQIERAHYLQELATRIKVEEKTLQALLRELKDEPRSNFSSFNRPNNIAVPRKASTFEQLGEFILGVLLLYPERRYSIMEKMKNGELFPGKQKKIFDELKKRSDNFALEEFINDCDESFQEDVNLIVLKTEQLIERENIDPKKIIDEYIKQFYHLHKKSRLDTLALEIRHAEARKDSTLIKKLSEEFNALSKT